MGQSLGAIKTGRNVVQHEGVVGRFVKAEQCLGRSGHLRHLNRRQVLAESLPDRVQAVAPVVHHHHAKRRPVHRAIPHRGVGPSREGGAHPAAPADPSYR